MRGSGHQLLFACHYQTHIPSWRICRRPDSGDIEETSVLQWLARLAGLKKDDRNKFTILDNISGEIKPGRMTLLLGPPGGGKSMLLKTLGSKMKQEGCKVGH